MKSVIGGRAYRPAIAAIGIYALGGLLAPAMAAAPDAPAPAATAASNQVEQVIVTARRRNETIQSTPLSVTAISPAQLKAAAAPDIRDLTGRTPGLVLDPVNAGPSAAAISIRGISFEDIEKSFDPAVGVLIDDVYIGTNTGQLSDTFDLQSVQVLRGPQGSLFGRNTIGGVITLQRTKPTGEFGGDVDALFGDYGRQEYHAVLNLPKLGNQLSVKVFGSSRYADGYERNVTLGKDTPRTDVKRFGATFLWQPTARFDANLTLEHAQERSQTDQASLSTSGDLICIPLNLILGIPGYAAAPANECNRNTKDDLYTTFSNKLGIANNDEDDVTLQMNYDLGGDTKLTAISGYRRNKEHVTQDFDSTSINFFDTVRDQKYDQFSQELRLSGKLTPKVDYVAGLYYFYSEYDLAQLTNYGPDLQIAAGLPAQGHQLVHHEAKSYAAFADIDWQFLDKWRLSIGGRYTSDDKSIRNNFVGAFDVSGSKSWSEFTPKATVDYRPNDSLMFYGSYSRGFRSGGFNGRGSTVYSATTPYNPETVDAYEIGAKTEWLDRRLTVNVSAFMTDYSNKQEEVVQRTPPGSPNPQETIVANAASATINGVELDVQAQPTRALTLRGTFGILNAKYDGFNAVDATFSQRTDDLSALHLRRAPRGSGGAGFDYKVESPLGHVTLTADYRYVGGHDTTITRAPGTGIWTGAGCATGTTASATCTYIRPLNDQRGYAKASNTVDASISIDHDMPTGVVRLTLYGRNLFDDRGLAATLPVAGLFTFGTPRPPRTYGVQLGYRF